MANENDDEKQAPRKRVDMTQAALAAVAALALGGGGGSLVTAQGVSAELRETRAVFVGRFDKIDQRMDEQTREAARFQTQLADHEKRIQAAELWRARTESQPPR